MFRIVGFGLVGMAAAAIVSPPLKLALHETNTVDIVIDFITTPEFNPVELNKLSRVDRLNFVTKSLQTTAQRSQERVLAMLFKAIEVNPLIQAQSFFVANRIFVVNATAALVESIVSDVEVDQIRLPATASLVGSNGYTSLPGSVASYPSWAVNRVGALEVWGAGNRGADIIVASIDSGVRSSHETLRVNFRKEFGWYDAVGQSLYPIDYAGHGTASMALAVGSRGLRGVAPDASWMACAACTRNKCDEAAVIACAQFVLCPSAPDGSKKTCSEAPHVVHNGWESMGTGRWYDTLLTAWNAAGIVAVFGSGNQGNDAKCSTIQGPAASSLVLAVGATDFADRAASFSSYGPTKDWRVKPDISAPGVRVPTADSSYDTGYSFRNGSSFSAAYATGTVALFLHTYPNATFNNVYVALTRGASNDLPSDLNDCGGLSNSKFPNNLFGAGIVNASMALTASPLRPTSSPTTTRTPFTPEPTTTPQQDVNNDTKTTLQPHSEPPTTTTRITTTSSPKPNTTMRTNTTTSSDTIVFPLRW